MAETRQAAEAKSAALRDSMTETREQLSDKLETLGQGILDTWDDASSVVSDTMGSVKGTVASSMEAMQATANAVGHAFDIRAHVRRYPWQLFGGAVLLGFVTGRLVGRARR